MIGVWPADAAVAGQFKVDCTFVKAAPDDPIVSPGQPGASHDHAFFGNTGINASSTFASMSSAASTCANNDRSAYWLPSLYRNGVKLNPSGFIVYYENRFPAGTQLEAFPAGFRMIIGNKSATTAAQVDGHISWGCSDNTQIGGKVPPTSCPSGKIQVRFIWPQCWDGQTSGDATTHMSFAPGGKCSAAFPHKMPTLRTNIYFPVGTTTGTVSFSSGNVFSVHEDFLDAWDPATLAGLVKNCLNVGKNCAHFTGTTRAA